MTMELLEGLTVVARIDSDGTAELTARFYYQGFAGVGSAWFDAQDVHEFAASLRKYPLPPNEVLELAGGYSQETHLSIQVRQATIRGQISVRIYVAEPVDFYDGPTSPSASAHVDLPTSYADLARFADRLDAVLNGHIEAAILSPYRF